jgi:multicomponent Na+:H+ antiporter subunit F
MTSSGLPLVLISGSLVAIAVALVRLVRGPCQADRVIALDVVFASTLTLTAGAALVSGRVLYLDIAVGLAMVGFVATIVWSRLIDASSRRNPDSSPGEEVGRPPGEEAGRPPGEEAGR